MTVMLLNRSRITARELSDHFEVSIRTIYRDIDALNLAGIPVISYPGNNGGFGIVEDYKIDRQVLGLTDLQTILSALKGINITLDNQQLNTAIGKLHSLVPVEETGQLELFNEQFVIDILPWGFRDEHRALLKTLHFAITENRLLSFTYRNNKGETLARTVEPMTLIFKGYTWYLFGYCRLRQAYRVFRISRVKEPQVPGQTFCRRLESYTRFLDSESGQAQPVELVLKFSPAARLKVEEYFEPHQIRLQEDGYLRVTASYPEDNWVYSLILSYGGNVEVISPRHIRGIIRQQAEKILNLYQT